MRFFRITIVIILFLSLQSAAQSTRQLIDSARKYKNSNYTKGIAFAKDAYRHAINNREDELTGESALMAGVNNYLAGNLDEALRWYLEAEKVFARIGSNAGLSRLYTEMVIFYLRVKKYPQAEDVSTRAIVKSMVVQDTSMVANAFNNRGLVFLDEEKYDSAIVPFRYAYNLYKSSGNRLGMAYSLDYLASALAEKVLYEQALECLDESRELREGLGDKTGAATAINNIGELYMKQKMPREAVPYFREAIAKAVALNYMDLEVFSLQQLAKAYELQGDYKNALLAQNRYIERNERMQEQMRIKQLEETQVKYETGKKEQQNRLLTEQNKTQALKLDRSRIILYGLVSITALLTVMFYLLYNRYRLKQQARLKEAIAAEQQQKAKEVLMAEENERKRIAADLHDGVGQVMSAAKMNLSAIHGQLVFASEEQRLFFESAIKMVDDGCKEVRVISHNMMPNALLKAGLTAAIREFVNMIPDRVLKVQLHAEGLNESMDKGTEAVLYRVVQECVQNVIKHAAATQLDISLIKEHDGVDIMIEDNGKGFDTSRIGLSDGLGTANVLKRISYLKGTIEWSSSPGNGTVVSIHVPA